MTENSSSAVVNPTKIQDITAWMLLAVLIVITLKTLSFLFIPLSISILFCYALGAPLEFLERRKVPRYLRIIAVVLFALLVSYLLGKLVHSNVADFKTRLPEFGDKFRLYMDLLLGRFDITFDEAREMVDAFLSNFRSADLKPIGNVVQQVGSSFFTFLGNVVWVLLFMVFILAERDSMGKRLVRGLGDERATPMLQAAEHINKAVQNYLGLKTLTSFITGSLVTVTLWLFGVPFAFLWGVLAFLLNFIPNIGSIVATLPPVAVALFHTGSIGTAVVVAVLITFIQMGVGNFVEPRLMGKGLNLSPLVVLLSLVFWGWMWGIVGMLVSVPLTAAIKIAFEQVESTRPLATFMSSR